MWEIFIPTLSHSCNSFISFLKFFIFYFLNLYFIKNKYNCRPLVGWKLKQENIIFLSGVGEIEMMERSGKRKMEVGAVWGAARTGQQAGF